MVGGRGKICGERKMLKMCAIKHAHTFSRQAGKPTTRQAGEDLDLNSSTTPFMKLLLLRLRLFITLHCFEFACKEASHPMHILIMKKLKLGKGFF